MNLTILRQRAVMATSLAAASVVAQQGAAANREDEQGLLGDIPGFASAASSPAPPASAASASSGGRPSDAPKAQMQPAPSKPAPAVVPQGRADNSASSQARMDVERAAFQLMPVRVVLQVGDERVISLPGAFALHAPEGFDSLVRSQIIERTAYLRSLSTFDSVRVVAEDLATGRQIPLDLVSVPKGSTPLPPMEVFVQASAADAARAGADSAARASEAASLDMVALTRYAAQSLYAPRRLVPATAGVRQVPVNPAPVEGLYRGWRIETVPIGAWRSGDLYVTAVRFTNTGDQPLDIDLQELRGRWLAATAQHTRLLASDPAWRTTTVYLVCDRPFDACR